MGQKTEYFCPMKFMQNRLRIQGYGPLDLARYIDNLFDSGRYNAERLLRTELTRVQSDAQLASFTANGFDEYQFNALGDACPACAALDGKHFRLDDMKSYGVSRRGTLKKQRYFNQV